MKSPETKFLTELFEQLDTAGIRYAVLRNAESLPKTLGGGDIDIQIACGTMDMATCCLSKAAVGCGGRLMAKMDSPHFRQLEFLGCTDGRWWGCCIDLFEGVYCQSVLPMADDGLLEKRIRNSHGIWTLDDERGGYLGFVKELVTNGVVSERYVTLARMAVAHGKDDFLLSASLRRFTEKVLNGSVGDANVFRRAWLVSMSVRHPFFFWGNRLRFSLSRIIRIIRPCGKMIAVMGTDGSGKTTILNKILPAIRVMNHGSTIIHHLKPDLLPPLGRFRGVKHELGHVCTTPHASRPSGFAGSIVRISYLLCDYILGYWLKVRKLLAKTPIAYWIFDRYAYDLIIDQRRFRIKLPQWIVKVFVFFVPRPDLILCLGGDAEIIYARKPETSLEEVQRQIDSLKKFCNGNKRAVWIDTTKSVGESVDTAMNAIFENLARSLGE